jgi:hypothetical protein
MSELILIGKSRKTGKWELLCDPSEIYDKHLRLHQKIAQFFPVNDDYSKVLFGRVQSTHAPLTLITSAENKYQQEVTAARNVQAENAIKSAAERQKKLDDAAAKKELDAHEAVIAEKTVQINEMRKSKGLELVSAPKYSPPKKVETIEQKKGSGKGQAAVDSLK